MIGRLAYAFAPFLAGVAGAADLSVIVLGAEPGRGAALVSVFTSEAAWMREPAAEASVPVDADGAARIAFDGLQGDQAAVSVVYDRNANGVLDTNVLGIPNEPFGFSNDAVAFFGPPDWEAAYFALAAERTTIRIHLAEAKK